VTTDRFVFGHARPTLLRCVRFDLAAVGSFTVSWLVLNGSVQLLDVHFAIAAFLGSVASFIWSALSNFLWVWRPPGPSVNPRELDVLRAAARGLGNKQIAAELGVSARTVQTHLTRVFGKLGVSSRTEAVLRRSRWAGSAVTSLEFERGSVYEPVTTIVPVIPAISCGIQKYL
jgi:DNA-binding CsgD family transcriptional regulator